jgi:anti-anti-sigma regulatory factor
MKKRTSAPAKKKRSAPAPKRASTTKVGALSLPAECTTADAEALKARLQKLVAHSGAVTLDRSAVQRVDTATLQMLAAFVRDRRADGLAVEWSGEAAAFTSAASLLGLASLL